MNELQEEIDAITFVEGDELSIVTGVAWNTFLKILVPMLPLVLICALPPAAIIAAIPFDRLTEHMDILQAMAYQSKIESRVLTPFAFIVMLTGTVTAVRTLACHHLGRLADFKTAMRRLPSFLAGLFILFALFFGFVIVVAFTAVLSGLIVKKGLGTQVVSNTVFAVLMGSLFAVLMGSLFAVLMVYFVKLFFFADSIVIGGKSPIESFGESMRLVRGRWWATLGVSIIGFLVCLMLSIPMFLSSMVEGLVAGFTDNYFVSTFFGWVTISLDLIGPWTFGTAFVAVFYLLRRWKCARAAQGVWGPEPPSDCQPCDGGECRQDHE